MGRKAETTLPSPGFEPRAGGVKARHATTQILVLQDVNSSVISYLHENGKELFRVRNQKDYQTSISSGVTENIRALCKVRFLDPKPKYVLGVSQTLGSLESLPLTKQGSECRLSESIRRGHRSDTRLFG
ncbi:hypothetical protein TNCV_2927231 [Trichonephila clavipes]|nr:hypothetical protein TNCV_2927231 [Trichonephila clavipes]